MSEKKPKSKHKRRKLFGLPSIAKNMSYVMFIGLLGLVYIFNSHYAEGNLRKTKKLENKIREAKWEYMSIKSDIMQKSTRSEIIRKLDGYEGLESKNLPRKIEASKS
ncbi:FtsL-like putative cell division protein [Portibacter marinus]|uniref:FtsL-like putative cell division protein n=1 Tax=Portibacter marinus TaxID=2898660 RepID=UPI001F3303DF|nr:FtsL-like putative cell division protein [Portibacter marinus]